MSSTEVIDLCEESNEDTHHWWTNFPHIEYEIPFETREADPEQGSTPRRSNEEHLEILREVLEQAPDFHVESEAGLVATNATHPEKPNDEDLEVVRDVPDQAPDFHVESEVGPVEIHSTTHNNPITGSHTAVDDLWPQSFKQRTLKFRAGYNIHTLYALWGQIDQLSLRKQRMLRLLALTNMLQQTASDSNMLQEVHRQYSKINGSVIRLVRDLCQERIRQQNLIRNTFNLNFS